MSTISLGDKIQSELIDSINDATRVSGLTHNFYKYPARFSPNFVRSVINTFTKPGDFIIDPFIGGGTSLVEARALGRRVAGVDINSLATFISKVKTTVISKSDASEILKWAKSLSQKMNLHTNFTSDEELVRNLDCKHTWPIKKSIQLCINNIDKLPKTKQQQFVKCALLKSSQWAIDTRKVIPSVADFRAHLLFSIESMLESILDYSTIVRKADKNWDAYGLPRLRILNRSCVGLESDNRISNLPKPKLILTSPPYPGVHVLYHRWQVHGRKETPAPYWITNKKDGAFSSYYTFGDRKEDALSSYFSNVYCAFRSLAMISGRRTILVQMIAFSKPEWQLPLYLEVMENAGFTEHTLPVDEFSQDNRLWRNVPNRKWHANYKGQTPSSKEVVLFHKLT